MPKKVLQKNFHRLKSHAHKNNHCLVTHKTDVKFVRFSPKIAFDHTNTLNKVNGAGNKRHSRDLSMINQII